MKPKSLVLAGIIGLSSMSLLQCKKQIVTSEPLSSYLSGKWRWTETVSPTRTIKQTDAGYEETVEISKHIVADGRENYYTVYSRNDKPYRYLRELTTNLTEDRTEGTVIKYLEDSTGTKYYIKYYLGFKADKTVDRIGMSVPMPAYNEAADTVRSYYRYLGP